MRALAAYGAVRVDLRADEAGEFVGGTRSRLRALAEQLLRDRAPRKITPAQKRACWPKQTSAPRKTWLLCREWALADMDTSISLDSSGGPPSTWTGTINFGSVGKPRH